MLVKESISFKRKKDPKETLMGIKPGTLIIPEVFVNGESLYVEMYLRQPTEEDLRRWDPSKQHTNDKILAWNMGILQQEVKDAFGPGKNLPRTFFPSHNSIFSLGFHSYNVRKLTNKEKEIVLRGLENPKNKKEVDEMLKNMKKFTGITPIL